MNIDEEKLMAFADGELSEAERAEIERALASDAALRARVAAHTRLRERLSAAFDGTLEESVPTRLLTALEAAPRAGGEIVDLAERRARRWSAREFAAIAASLAAGLVIGVGVMNARAPMIAASEGGLVARGALARALDSQLAADAPGAVRIGLSFRAQDGGYCRTFELTRAAASGLACREADRWAVVMTAAGEGTGEVRMAAASAAVLQVVEGMIEGQPLDADEEARVRDAGWR
jgi:hypothetical protein